MYGRTEFFRVANGLELRADCFEGELIACIALHGSATFINNLLLPNKFNPRPHTLPHDYSLKLTNNPLYLLFADFINKILVINNSNEEIGKDLLRPLHKHPQAQPQKVNIKINELNPFFKLVLKLYSIVIIPIAHP